MLHNAWSPSSMTHHSWSISHCQWWCGFTIIFMWLSWSFFDAIITWMMTIIIKIIKETKMKNWRLSHPISCWILIYILLWHQDSEDYFPVGSIVPRIFLRPCKANFTEWLCQSFLGRWGWWGCQNWQLILRFSMCKHIDTILYDSIRFYTQYVYIKYTYCVYIHLITFIS